MKQHRSLPTETKVEFSRDIIAARAAGNLDIFLGKLVSCRTLEIIDNTADETGIFYTEDDSSVTGMFRFVKNAPMDEMEDRIAHVFRQMFDKTGYATAGSAICEMTDTVTVGFTLELDMKKAKTLIDSPVSLAETSPARPVIPPDMIHDEIYVMKSGKVIHGKSIRRAV